jgi:uncharacterized membrane protein YhaH (DUF805 family)
MKEALFSFEGRAGRKTWWLTVIGLNVVVLAVWGIAMGLAFVSETAGTIGMILAGLVGLAAAIAGLAVSVRRWHDVDKSGWFVLIGLIPVVGLYALVMNGFVQGTPGSNTYGPAPAGSSVARASQTA